MWGALLGGLVGLGAAGVAAELLARRAVRRGGYYPLQPNLRQLLRVDRETLPTLEPEVRLEFNRDGERGDEPPRDLSRTARVLVAGGSAAECYLLDQASAWPAVVQRHLNQPEVLERLGVERVHVGNVSRSLVNCEYLCLMLEKSLPRYTHLDLVVTFVGASDVVAWLEKGTPAEVRSSELSLDYVFPEHPEVPFSWKPGGLALRRVLSRWHKRLFHPVQVREGAGRTIGRNRAMRAAAKVLIDEVPDPAPLVRHFEHHFRRLVEVARSRGARVLVVRQPWFDREFSDAERALLWNFGQGRPYEGTLDTYYTHRVVSHLMAAVDAAQARVAEELGVAQLDLMPLLERSFTTYYDYLHFTPTGARAVASPVAAAAADALHEQVRGD